MAEPTSSTESHESADRPPKFGGGPMGLGDPDDMHLRRVEKEILIAKKIRDKTRTDKCAAEVQVFNECCRRTGFGHVFKCRTENDNMKSCMGRWYFDPQFIQECTDEYLRERSEFRRTGVFKKQQKKARVV